ncbi:hypothetical protein [Streptomyces uncialis]|uniref:hypothetical protein n=1 Tax=Streptomyces uncialis TaxID=1048205 RepID=UPI0034116665
MTPSDGRRDRAPLSPLPGAPRFLVHVTRTLTHASAPAHTGAAHTACAPGAGAYDGAGDPGGTPGAA